MVKVPKGYRSKNVNDLRGSRRGGGGFRLPRRGGGGGLGGGGLGGGGLGGGGGGGGLGGALGGALGGGGGGGGRRGCGCGGLALIVIIVFALLFFSCLSNGTDFMGDLNTTGPAPQAQSQADSPEIADTFDLVNFVLDDVQDFWIEEFDRAGQTYPVAKLNIFEQSVDTDGCGRAASAVGPFYCPADSEAYIDMAFMIQLQNRLGAPGDFSQAYILAHEIGHHVQNVLGTNQAVRDAQQGMSRSEANQLSVRMELQADCLAGMWARSADQRGILDAGDLDEGVRAAGAVGDDAITGSSNAENFTHGTSEQRVRWFSTGFRSGEYGSCDTFEPSYDSL
ncbi:MAG: KPN_02809 family neutral zinc metallopeptidase [Acidimicrobiales bacterium]